VLKALSDFQDLRTRVRTQVEITAPFPDRGSRAASTGANASAGAGTAEKRRQTLQHQAATLHAWCAELSDALPPHLEMLVKNWADAGAASSAKTGGGLKKSSAFANAAKATAGWLRAGLGNNTNGQHGFVSGSRSRSGSSHSDAGTKEHALQASPGGDGVGELYGSSSSSSSKSSSAGWQNRSTASSELGFSRNGSFDGSTEEAGSMSGTLSGNASIAGSDDDVRSGGAGAAALAAAMASAESGNDASQPSSSQQQPMARLSLRKATRGTAVPSAAAEPPPPEHRERTSRSVPRLSELRKQQERAALATVERMMSEAVPAHPHPSSASHGGAVNGAESMSNDARNSDDAPPREKRDRRVRSLPREITDRFDRSSNNASPAPGAAFSVLGSSSSSNSDGSGSTIPTWQQALKAKRAAAVLAGRASGGGGAVRSQRRAGSLGALEAPPPSALPQQQQLASGTNGTNASGPATGSSSRDKARGGGSETTARPRTTSSLPRSLEGVPVAPNWRAVASTTSTTASATSNSSAPSSPSKPSNDSSGSPAAPNPSAATATAAAERDARPLVRRYTRSMERQNLDASVASSLPPFLRNMVAQPSYATPSASNRTSSSAAQSQQQQQKQPDQEEDPQPPADAKSRLLERFKAQRTPTPPDQSFTPTSTNSAVTAAVPEASAAPSEAPPPDSGAAPNAATAAAPGSAQEQQPPLPQTRAARKEEPWECSVCKRMNKANARSCMICYTRRGYLRAASVPRNLLHSSGSSSGSGCSFGGSGSSGSGLPTLGSPGSNSVIAGAKATLRSTVAAEGAEAEAATNAAMARFEALIAAQNQAETDQPPPEGGLVAMGSESSPPPYSSSSSPGVQTPPRQFEESPSTSSSPLPDRSRRSSSPAWAKVAMRNSSPSTGTSAGNKRTKNMTNFPPFWFRSAFCTFSTLCIFFRQFEILHVSFSFCSNLCLHHVYCCSHHRRRLFDCCPLQ